MKTVGKLITLSTLAAGGAGLAGTAAYGYFATTGTGSGSAQVGTLNAATLVSATAGSNGLVTVSWTAPSVPGGGTPTGYLVERIASGGAAANACGSSAISLLPGSSTSCNDTVAVAGTYTYRVTTYFRSWTAQSAASAPVTVVLDTTAPTVAVTFPVAGATYNSSSWAASGCSSAICGTAADAGTGATGVSTVSVTLQRGSDNKYWNGSAWVSGATAFPGTGTTSWSRAFAAANFTDGAFTVSVTATDAAGNTSGATTVSFNYDGTAPNAPVVNAWGPVTNANKTAITVGGTAEPYAGLSLVFSDGAGHTVTRSTTAVAAGTWSLVNNDLSSLNDGTITLSVTATDSAGNTSAAGTRTATKDAALPSVTIGVATGQSNPASSNPVRFAVTFSEGVTGFDQSDITLSGTAPGTKTITVTPTDSANYIVAVSGITGSGTVTASVNAGAAFDSVNNPSTASASSATVTVNIDTTAPTISSVTRLDTNPATSSTVSFQVTFSETALNVDAADFAPATTGSFALGAAGINSVTGSGTTYTVVASTGSGVGDATVGLKLASSPTITDSAGNSAAGNGVATGTNQAYNLSAVTVNATATRQGNDSGNKAYIFSGQVVGSGGSVKVEVFANAGATGTPAETLTVTPTGTTWATGNSSTTYKTTDAKSIKVTYTAANGRSVTNAAQTF